MIGSVYTCCEERVPSSVIEIFMVASWLLVFTSRQMCRGVPVFSILWNLHRNLFLVMSATQSSFEVFKKPGLLYSVSSQRVKDSDTPSV